MTAPFFNEDIMHGTCPTVIIETVNGPVTINQSDYDPALHKLFVEPTLKVVEQNGAWFVVQNDGSLAENFNAAGYKKQADAEKALGMSLAEKALGMSLNA
jgi:hypothetical protein